MENETTQEPKIGRPTKHSQELADEICALICEGKSVRTICKMEHMPSMQTFWSWIRTKPDFLEQYARAKQEQSDALIEECLDIADNSSNDWMEIHKKNGDVEVKLNKEAVMRSKLRIETRQWMATKLKPKKYGANPVQIQNLDKDGNPTDPTMNASIIVAQESLEKALADILSGKARGAQVERNTEVSETL